MPRKNWNSPVDVVCPGCGTPRIVTKATACKKVFTGYCDHCKGKKVREDMAAAKQVAQSQAKYRQCLKCGSRFKSLWIGNRLCGTCRTYNSSQHDIAEDFVINCNKGGA